MADLAVGLSVVASWSAALPGCSAIWDLNGFSTWCCLQDANSLAHYNVGPETMLSLAVRERGGRKR